MAKEMKRIDIDTSAYFALADDSDANYTAAQAVLEDLAGARNSLFTTTFVVAETHGLMIISQYDDKDFSLGTSSEFRRRWYARLS